MRPRTGVCEPLMPDAVASKMQSQLSTFGFTTQEFSMVGGYTENLKKPQNCQNWGWVLAQVWGHLLGTIYCTYMYCDFSPTICPILHCQELNQSLGFLYQERY